MAAAAATASTPAARTGLHLPALTGLRIVAALAVYASHVGPPAGAPEWIRTLLASGYMGVTIFFVLSGFVLALNYLHRLRRPSGREFYGYIVARLARVYPLYLLILLYIMVRQHAAGGPLDDWWKHALAIQAWDPSTTVAFSYNGPGWSIGVELLLYACFPLLVPLVARLATPRAALLAVAGVVVAMLAATLWFAATSRGALPLSDPGSPHRWLYRTPLLRLGDFALGMLAAQLFFLMRNDGRAVRAGGMLTFAAVIVTFGLMAWPANLNSAWSWDIGYALPAAVLIFGLAVAPGCQVAKLLSLPFIVLLGEASYAFYLAHQPALGFLAGGRWTTDFSITTVAYEVLTLGAILCLAAGLHTIVERPARTYLRRWLTPPVERKPKIVLDEPSARVPMA